MIPVFLMPGIHEPHDTNQWYEACFFIDKLPGSDNKPVKPKEYRQWLVYHVLAPFVWRMGEKYHTKMPVERFRLYHEASGWNDNGTIEQWNLTKAPVSYVKFTLCKYDGTNGNDVLNRKRRGVTFLMPKGSDEREKIKFIADEFRRYLGGFIPKRVICDSGNNFEQAEKFSIT